MLQNIPYVIEKNKDGERCYDIYSRLLEDRTIFLGDEVDSSLANSIVAQLLLLDQQSSDRDIYIYINSPGGCITSGMAIYDTIQYIKAECRTVCVGLAASMAAVLLAAGTKGKRFALPNSRVLIHQPRSYGSPGEVKTVTDQEIDVKLIKGMRVQTERILSSHTGQSIQRIRKDCEKDKWMTAEEALDYGLIDEIITKKP